MDAACSEAPSAMDWLEDATWPDADATCSAPSLIPWAMAFMGFVMERARRNAIPRTATTVISDNIMVSHLMAFTAANASALSISAIRAHTVFPIFKGVKAERTGLPL